MLNKPMYAQESEEMTATVKISVFRKMNDRIIELEAHEKERDRLRAVIKAWMPTLRAWANPVPGDVVSPSEMHFARALLTAIGV